MKQFTAVFLFLIFSANSYTQTRSFDDLFPNAGNEIKTSVFSANGYVKSSQKESGFVILGGAQSGLNPDIVNIVMRNNPIYLVESILIVSGNPKEIKLLDIYNALGNIRDLKGREYNSATRKRAVPLFEEATRITSQKQTSSIPDPAPSVKLPETETVYVKLKDVNFGNTFYRGDMAVIQNGIRFTLTNFRNITYLMVPVMKEEKFIAQLYIEPVKKGIFIYSIAGADISDFIASKIDVESAISKRLAVITGWALDGILKN